MCKFVQFPTAAIRRYTRRRGGSLDSFEALPDFVPEERRRVDERDSWRARVTGREASGEARSCTWQFVRS